MEELGFYTFGDREYFETPRQFRISPVYADLIRSLLPLTWSLLRFDVWLRATTDKAVLAPQGFKIHVSCSVASAEEMLRRIVPTCTDAGVMFKVVADPTLHKFMNSKRYHRGGSGKFAAIYPPDEERMLALLETLHQATRDLDGPYILSDKRYRNSRVIFYRYGAFQRVERLNVDGTRTMMMQTPDGVSVPDERAPYFHLPDWVRDPVPEEVDLADDDSELLNGRYRLEEALTFSNTGGIYRAVDSITGQKVVIKEARPHTLTWAGRDLAVEAKLALGHEHDCLQCLRDLPCVPQLVEMYDEWEHTFLVVSYFDGIPLAELRAREDFILMTKMHDPAEIVRFCSQWRDLCLRVLDAVTAIHDRGVIIGDISPGNILVSTVTGEIAVIDVEGAWLSDSTEHIARFGTQWHNPGFRKQETRLSASLSRSDDSYACGMLLYNMVCPTQGMFELDNTHPIFRMLDHFVEAGLPAEVRTIIQLLLDGRGEEARTAADAWDPSSISPAEIVLACSTEGLGTSPPALVQHLVTAPDDARFSMLGASGGRDTAVSGRDPSLASREVTRNSLTDCGIPLV